MGVWGLGRVSRAAGTEHTGQSVCFLNPGIPSVASLVASSNRAGPGQIICSLLIFPSGQTVSLWCPFSWQGQKKPPQRKTHLQLPAPSRGASGLGRRPGRPLDCGIWLLHLQCQPLLLLPTSLQFPSCLTHLPLCKSLHFQPSPHSLSELLNNQHSDPCQVAANLDVYIPLLFPSCTMCRTSLTLMESLNKPQMLPAHQGECSALGTQH